MAEYHVPVMLNECLEGLHIRPDGIYADVTFGGGGHSRAILGRLGKRGRLVAFDQDEHAKENLASDPRLIFIDQNFEYLKNHLAYQGLLPVNGLLADLGVSSHQFDVPERGFSYRYDDALLDMRMHHDSGITASEVLMTYSEERLREVFYLYGELSNAKAFASHVAGWRSRNRIETVADLKEAIAPLMPRHNEYKLYSQVFQALRIEVNRELDVLKELLLQSAEVIGSKGRLVIMSYHSLEDRLVKNFINSGNFLGKQEKDFYGNVLRPFEPVSRKAIVPSADELAVNSRARSAKLRVAEKV